MKSLRFAAVALLLTTVSTAAVAFQEQRQGSTPGEKAPAAEQGASSPAAAVSGTPDSGGKSSGTEIRIPGLGSLGVLPKMDFGLELLYGASDQKIDDSRAIAPNSDDLAIKGTLRKRF